MTKITEKYNLEQATFYAGKSVKEFLFSLLLRGFYIFQLPV